MKQLELLEEDAARDTPKGDVGAHLRRDAIIGHQTSSEAHQRLISTNHSKWSRTRGGGHSWAISRQSAALSCPQLQAHEWDDDEGQSACDPRP
jgi:hypothetical protein